MIIPPGDESRRGIFVFVRIWNPGFANIMHGDANIKSIPAEFQNRKVFR
jgi:hypothetical protein